MDWIDEGTNQGPRPCERCGAGTASIDSANAAQYAMCREVTFVNYVVMWLCYDCRKLFLRRVLSDQIMDELVVTETKMDLWRGVAGRVPPREINWAEFTAIVREFCELKRRVAVFADKFMAQV